MKAWSLVPRMDEKYLESSRWMRLKNQGVIVNQNTKVKFQVNLKSRLVEIDGWSLMSQLVVKLHPSITIARKVGLGWFLCF